MQNAVLIHITAFTAIFQIAFIFIFAFDFYVNQVMSINRVSNRSIITKLF